MLREAFLVEEIQYFMKNWALGKKITTADFFYQLLMTDYCYTKQNPTNL